MNYMRHKYGVVQKYKHDASVFSAWWWPKYTNTNTKIQTRCEWVFSMVVAQQGPCGAQRRQRWLQHHAAPSSPAILTNTNIQVYKYTDANKKYSVGRYYAQDTNRLTLLCAMHVVDQLTTIVHGFIRTDTHGCLYKGV